VKLCKSEVARRVDDEIFEIVEKTGKKNPSFLGVHGLQWRRACTYAGWQYKRARTCGKTHENLRR
jgi:hypothetical protein